MAPVTSLRHRGPNFRDFRDSDISQMHHSHPQPMLNNFTICHTCCAQMSITRNMASTVTSCCCDVCWGSRQAISSKMFLHGSSRQDKTSPPPLLGRSPLPMAVTQLKRQPMTSSTPPKRLQRPSFCRNMNLKRKPAQLLLPAEKEREA